MAETKNPTRNLRDALVGANLQSTSEAKPLWEMFPDYSLHPSLNSDEKLAATLKECYAPKAIRLRMMFLTHAGRLTEELAGKDDQQCPVSIANDLFARAGSAFEAHLRNCSLSDLRLFNRSRQDFDSLPKLTAFFKARENFTPQAWETMQALLFTVWGWAQKWRLNHYAYVHFAGLALIEGHWLERRARLGWHCAKESFDLPALSGLNDAIPPPPKGFPLYRGASTAQDATNRKKAQKNYIQLCRRMARQVIEASLLTNVKGCREEVIAEIGEIAWNYCEKVDSEYSKKKETLPGRYWHKYGQDIEWTARRVILRQDWKQIAPEEAVTTLRSAVERTLPKLFLREDSAFPHKRRYTKHPAKKTNKNGGARISTLLKRRKV